MKISREEREGARKETAPEQTLIKSFAGVQGVVFQKNPLVAEGIEVLGWASEIL